MEVVGTAEAFAEASNSLQGAPRPGQDHPTALKETPEHHQNKDFKILNPGTLGGV